MTDDEFEFHAWPPRRVGGQHAGLVGYGVLAIHVRTGLAAVATDGPSQMVNQSIAVARLQATLEVLRTTGHFADEHRNPDHRREMLEIDARSRMLDAIDEARCQGLAGAGSKATP